MECIFPKILFLIFLSRTTYAEKCEHLSHVKITCGSYRRGFEYKFAGVSIDSLYECISYNIPINAIYPNSKVVLFQDYNGTVESDRLAKINALYLYGGQVHFIPDGIQEKLPNLKALTIRRGYLTVVRKENLKQFGDRLEFLWLTENRIFMLDGSWLNYNPNVKMVSLTANPDMLFSDLKFFEKIKSFKYLRYLSLYTGGCIHQVFDAAFHGRIANFKWNSSKCQVKNKLQKQSQSEESATTLYKLDKEACLKEKLPNELVGNVLREEFERLRIANDNNISEIEELKSFVKSLMSKNSHSENMANNSSITTMSITMDLLNANVQKINTMVSRVSQELEDIDDQFCRIENPF